MEQENEDYASAQKQNWDSRRDTLRRMLEKVIDKLDAQDPYDAMLQSNYVMGCLHNTISGRYE